MGVVILPGVAGPEVGSALVGVAAFEADVVVVAAAVSEVAEPVVDVVAVVFV